MRKISSRIFFLLLGVGVPLGTCVKSNLDNAFDPATPLGLLAGMAIGITGSGGNSGSSGQTMSSICNRTPTSTEFPDAGSFSYTVPTDAIGVSIEVIGGGGGGATYSSTVNSALYNGGDGGDSFVTVSGGAELVRATGGKGGTQGITGTAVGTGGAGGTPSGIAGGNGTTTHGSTSTGVSVAGANLPGSTQGDGGNAYVLLTVSCCEGGGSGGSGGKNTITQTGLAGATLNITVGAAGTNAWNTIGSTVTNSGDGYGKSGRVLITVY